MPKFPAIPRLSIVIPIGRDLAAFETSLISVLENQPSGCEILVANDGSYDDPFDLCDEVRFVVGSSASLVDLVAAGAAASRARLVHVLADGIQATCGWLDGALEKFEHDDAAAVAPVIRHAASGQVIAAGWHDHEGRLCDPLLTETDSIGPRNARIVGAYLQASFWRREVLTTLTEAFAGRDPEEAAFAYAHLSRAAGWRCVLAPESNLHCDSPDLPWQSTGFRRGQRLRAIQSHFGPSSEWSLSLGRGSRALLRNLAKPRLWSESLGQASAPLATAAIQRALRPHAVACCDRVPQTLKIPTRSLNPRRTAV